MSTTEILMITATFLSPFFAVFANNIVEKFKEARKSRIVLFETLMMTRANPLSPERIRALNAIDLVFNRKKRDKEVREKWKQLHSSYMDASADDVRQRRWLDLNNALFIAIGKVVGREVDAVYIEKGGYYPQAYADVENELGEIRGLLKHVLDGSAAIGVQLKQ